MPIATSTFFVICLDESWRRITGALDSRSVEASGPRNALMARLSTLTQPSYAHGVEFAVVNADSGTAWKYRVTLPEQPFIIEDS